MASPLKFRSLAQITGPGEIIGDTVVLDLKNDVEKLSEEKEALKLLHDDSVKKCDELTEKLEDAEIRCKEIITSKEKMIEDGHNSSQDMDAYSHIFNKRGAHTYRFSIIICTIHKKNSTLHV